MENRRTYLFYGDDSIILKSSSGGAFYTIAISFIESGGIVYGAAIDRYTGQVKHIRASTEEELNPILGSKYVFSDYTNVFVKIKQDLINNLKVLFSGTPCQVGKLIRYLDTQGISKKNLITIDFICFGCPSVKDWKKYLDKIKIKPPYDISFRYKKNGWVNYYVKFNNIIEPHQRNYYMKNFLSCKSLMKTCFSCTYKGDNHIADITLGDAWGVNEYCKEHYNFNGTSLIIFKKDISKILNILSVKGNIYEVNFNEAIKYNPSYFRCSKMRKHNVKKNIKNIIKKPILFTYKRFFDFLYKPSIKNKIGIVSDFHYSNFGNKLQGFALRKVINRNGFETFLLTKTYIVKYPFKKLNNALNGHVFNERNNQIFKTSIKYEGRPFFYKDNTLNKLNKVSGIIFGSDQIWNFQYNVKNLNFNLGEFLKNKTIPHIAYGASIGCDYLPDNIVQLFKDNFQHFNKITLREIDSVSLLKSKGIESSFALDPVFLLSEQEWKESINKFSTINVPKKPYNFYYMLTNHNLYECENSINCMDHNSEYYSINQFDFLNLIVHADKVITDSYHCIIFSLIFHKRFVICKRKDDYDMQIRFRSLFKVLNIEFKFNELYEPQYLDCSDAIKQSLEVITEFLRECEKK